MKITKKVTSIVLALMLVISAFAGLSITAGAVAADTTVTTYDAETPISLYVHKYAMNNDAEGKIDDYVGNSSDRTGTTADANNVPDDADPLEGVEFTMWKVGNMSTAVPADNLKPATEDAANTAYGTAVDTKTTNSSGVAQFDIVGANAGLYFVMETDAPDMVASAGKATSFYVYLPMAVNNEDASGTQWLTGVSVYPKNIVTLGAAVLEKKFNGTSFSSITIDPEATNVMPKFALYKGTSPNGQLIVDEIEISKSYMVYTDQLETIPDFNDEERIAIAQRDGKIAVTGLPVGDYYFVETDPATINGTVYGLDQTPKSFSVTEDGLYSTATLTNDDYFGTLTPAAAEGNNSFTLELNNQTTPTIEKKVAKTADAAGQDSVEQEIGKNVVWTLTPTVPSDIANYDDYYVTDPILTGLTYVSTTVTGASSAYDESAYTVTHESGTVKIQFNKVADSYSYLSGNAPVIKITTQVNKDALVDTEIANQATINYDNGFETGSSPSNKPTVVTRGLTIVKVDANDNTVRLQGAVFNFYTDAQCTTAVDLVDVGNGEYRMPDTTETISLVTKQTTNASGEIKITGLDPAVTTYYVKETTAPTGYQLNTSELNVVLTTGQKITQNTITITNAKIPNLPITGGMGTILFTVAGLVLIGGAAFFFIRSRKSSKEEA